MGANALFVIYFVCSKILVQFIYFILICKDDVIVKKVNLCPKSRVGFGIIVPLLKRLFLFVVSIRF